LLCHNAINDITEGEPNPDRLNDIASITIYRVKKGDTLWKLAKRFNTTVDEIVKLNSIENPDLIYPNERFIILKRVV
jgi:LysM repeat protein